MAKRPSVSTQAACRSRPLTQRRRGKVQALLSITSLLLLCEVVVAPETSGNEAPGKSASFSAAEQAFLQSHISDVKATIASYPDLSTIDFREDGVFNWNVGSTSVVSGTYNGSIAAVRKITASNRTNEVSAADVQFVSAIELAIGEIDTLRLATNGRVPFFARYLAHAKDENNNPVLIVERVAGDTLDHYYENESLVAERKRLREKAYENLFRAAIFVWHMDHLGLLHNDLFPRNMVVDPAQMLITIIDFNRVVMTKNLTERKGMFYLNREIEFLMDLFAETRTGFGITSRYQLDKAEEQFIKEFKFQSMKRCEPASLVRHQIFQQHGLVYENYLSRMAPDTPPIECAPALSSLEERIAALRCAVGPGMNQLKNE